MTRNKNFSGKQTPSIIDDEYEKCNFAQDSPIDVGGKKRGVRIFPGDDTPRKFINCNLVNCEPPPGSILIGFNNTAIVERNLVIDSEIVEIDGEEIEQDILSNRIHGRFDAGTNDYVELPEPIDSIID